MITRSEYSRSLKTACAVIACFLGGGVLFADTTEPAPNTWYVNAANYGKEGMDGLTAETGWGDLQTAHDNAAAGDTIKVVEGVYSQGSGKTAHSRLNRVVVSKPLTFEAVGEVSRTHIVGELSTGNGWGDSGMRAICVVQGGAGTVFKGFTIRNGSGGGGDKKAWNYNGNGNPAGGGINCYGTGESAWKTAYFVDCVISNNAAKWGSAMYGGTAIRCLIANNVGSGNAGVCCSAALLNSAVVGVRNANSSARSAVGISSYVVNSLIAAVQSIGCMDEGACQTRCYNTLFTSYGYKSMYSGPAYTNCAETSCGVYSPGTFDFRPIAGLEADDTGKTEYLAEALQLLDLPECIENTDYNGNPIDMKKATCDLGPVQGAVENAPGAVLLPLGTLVDGENLPVLYRSTYIRADEWPRTLVLTPTQENFYSYVASGTLLNGPARRFLQRDGTCHIMPPPFGNQLITLTESTYKYEYWCDPEADAETAEGTEAKPFRTVQAAIDAATNAVAAASGAVVINLMPGDYREGEVFAGSHTNRFVVPAGHAILIRSTEGPENTTVYGKADPNPVDPAYAGCGPAAIRCAAVMDVNSALQGITFADGHSNFASSKDAVTSDRAGGIYSPGDVNQILDCVVTNCTAVRESIGNGGIYMRCRFYDCVSWGGAFRSARLVSCYVDPTCRSGQRDSSSNFTQFSIVGKYCAAVLCTAPAGTYWDCYWAYSMVFGNQKVYNLPQWGSVFRSATSVVGGATGYAVKDLGFVDYDGGDLRLCSGLFAANVSAGAIGERGTASWGAWATNVASFAQSDVDGKRLKVVDGKLLPGCYHETVDGVYVVASKGSVEVSKDGNAYSDVEKGRFIQLDGFPISITPGEGSRPCVGVLINGVTNRFDEADDKMIVLSESGVAAAGGGIYAEAIYTTDWYVDPNGDDSAYGYTPGMAKKTLSAAMAVAASGDTVHAAEGYYSDGAVKAAKFEAHPPAVVFIPQGRKLVADGAVEKTFIVGQIGTDEFTDEIGCGSNSVRCVHMDKKTELRGFTLMNGSAYPAGSGTYKYGSAYNCGAVYGSDRETVFVQDCVISNCAAYNGAAGREVAFINCRIFENRANVGVTSECYHYGCIIDRNYADESTLYLHTRVIDTTVGFNAYKLDGTPGTAIGYASSDKAFIANSLILGLNSLGSMAIPVSNCVFAIHPNSKLSITNNSFNSRFADIDELQIDDNYRPIAGSNVACDIADASILSESAALMKLRERANNGCRLDAGALEADWRGRYASDVGGRSFVVSSASNSAEETPSRTVLLPDGASLTGEWVNGSGRMRTYLVRFVVSEGATLSLTVDGRSVEFSPGSHEYRIASAGESVSLELASSGGTAEILSGGWMRGTMMVIR